MDAKVCKKKGGVWNPRKRECTRDIEMDVEKFSYEVDPDGYMLFYKGKPIGGAGVQLPRVRPLHWRPAQANVRDFRRNARQEIEAIKQGKGETRFIENITRIDLEEVT